MSEYIVSLERTIFVNAEEDTPEEIILERAAETFNDETWRSDECEIIDFVED